MMFYQKSKVLLVLEIRNKETILHGYGIDRVKMTVAANVHNKNNSDNPIRGHIVERKVSPAYMGWLGSNIKFLHDETSPD